MRNGRHVGVENSHTTSVPLGLITRRISRNAAAVSSTLRSPKEIVMASKLASAYGSRRASAATKLRLRPALLADQQHAKGKIGRDNPCAAARKGLARGARPRCQVQDQLSRPRLNGIHDVTAPRPVLAEREHIVGEVVARSHSIEHRRDVAAPLVERGARAGLVKAGSV